MKKQKINIYTHGMQIFRDSIDMGEPNLNYLREKYQRQQDALKKVEEGLKEIKKRNNEINFLK